MRASRTTRSSSQATCHAINFSWSTKVVSFGIVSASSKNAEGGRPKRCRTDDGYLRKGRAQRARGFYAAAVPAEGWREAAPSPSPNRFRSPSRFRLGEERNWWVSPNLAALEHLDGTFVLLGRLERTERPEVPPPPRL